MVMTRSSPGMLSDRAFRKVVLPEPVPPEIKMLYFAFTNVLKYSLRNAGREPIRISLSMVIGCSGNLRIVMTGPFKATGYSTILTRDPFSSLASTIGDASLTTRLHPATICWMTSSNFSLDSKPAS